jgi:meso-butanediol dehydrogenase/(S,S)-butanediol dehydrogenase/diacetyl reductase
MVEKSRKTPEFVLVSGAAGGVGSATARRFVEDGARVAITDINAERLQAVADEIGAVAPRAAKATAPIRPRSTST